MEFYCLVMILKTRTAKDLIGGYKMTSKNTNQNAVPKIRRYALRVLLTILALLIVVCAAFLVYREFRKSAANTRSAEIVAQGGISEMREIELNGTRQYVFIETQDINNPVMLFLHGGPGLAIPFGASSRGLYPNITEHITAVYLDQRGAGKSYRYTDVPNLTIRQFVDDILELSESLRKEFGQDKIYIAAVSFSTIPALRAVAERPDLFRGYFAQAQVTNVVKQEQNDYERILEQASEKDKETLMAMGPPPYAGIDTPEYKTFSSLSDKTISDKMVQPNLLGIADGALFSPDYSLGDIFDTMLNAQSANFSESGLVNEMYGVDLHTEIPKIDVPIYIFSGLYDTAAPLAVSQEYINALSAPHKELIVMEQSGHILCRDDYEKMESAILERVAP